MGAFTTQYYQMFDNPATRPQLQALYNAEQSLLSFEGQQMQGSAKIMEKLGSLTFQKIAHLITAVDCQPMFDGGILINVLGQLKVKCLICIHCIREDEMIQTDDDPAHGFSQAFVLKPDGQSWFIAHDVFRLALHHVATGESNWFYALVYILIEMFFPAPDPLNLN